SGMARAVVAASGMALGAGYLLTLLQRVFFGPLKEPPHDGHGPVADLCVREVAALLPIAVLCVAIGVFPQPMLDTAKPDIDVLAAIADRARQRAASPAQPAAATRAAADQPSEREPQ